MQKSVQVDDNPTVAYLSMSQMLIAQGTSDDMIRNRIERQKFIMLQKAKAASWKEHSSPRWPTASVARFHRGL